jgi:glycosyltransferase involved in cell wall biosynthesis
VLLEAMACGKPVIASNLPGVRSVVEEGKNGYLVEPGDVEELRARIELLLGDRQSGRKMGEQGRAKVEKKYAWPTIIPRLEQIYKNVLSNGHTGD